MIRRRCACITSDAGPLDEEPTAAGDEIDHLDTAALEQCIRANLWP